MNLHKNFATLSHSNKQEKKIWNYFAQQKETKLLKRHNEIPAFKIYSKGGNEIPAF